MTLLIPVSEITHPTVDYCCIYYDRLCDFCGWWLTMTVTLISSVWNFAGVWHCILNQHDVLDDGESDSVSGSIQAHTCAPTWGMPALYIEAQPDLLCGRRVLSPGRAFIVLFNLRAEWRGRASPVPQKNRRASAANERISRRTTDIVCVT